MKLQKTLVGALAALVTFGLLASCQNAASPAKVKSVKASQLTCAEGTAVTAENAEEVAKVMVDMAGEIADLKASVLSNVGIAKSVLSVSADIVKATAEEEDPFKAIEDALEQFTKDLNEKNAATLNLNETVNLDESDEEFGTFDGKVVVKAKANAKSDATAEGVMTASASGSGEVKVNVNYKAAKEAVLPVTQAIINTTAKAEVKGFSMTMDPSKMMTAPEDALTVKGSAAASDGASVGAAFKLDETVGKIIANVKVSAKVDSKDINKIVENADKMDVIAEIVEDMLTLEFDVEIYTPSDEKVYTKSFDSVKALDTWLAE